MKQLKSLLLVGTLVLACSSFAGAKTRQFTIGKTVMCGNVQLAPGTYRVEVREGTAEITDMNHFADKKPISVAATVQKADQKFENTNVQVESSGDLPRVTEIDLSNTRTSLRFGE